MFAPAFNKESFSTALQISLIDGASVALPVRRQAEDYLMQLTVSSEGLSLAFHIIDNEEFNAVRLFWAFSTVIYHLPTIGAIMSPQRCYQSVFEWLKRTLASFAKGVPEMVLNKHAQMMVIGAQEHWLSNNWPSVFSDLFNLVDSATAPGSADSAAQYPAELVLTYAMRFYECIDERVVDQSIQRSKEVKNRDSAIKDRMRIEVIPRLIQVMYGTLCAYHHANPELVSLCLSVVQNYIDWADVGYFLNAEWINLLYFLMSNTALRSLVCECLISLVGKGQQTAELKLETLRTMRLVEAIPSLVDAVVSSELQKPLLTGALYCLSSLDLPGFDGGSWEAPDPFVANVCALVVGTATEAMKTASVLPEAVRLVHAIVPHAVRLFDLPIYTSKEAILPWLQTYVKTPFVTPEEEEQIVGSVLRQSLLPDNESFAFFDLVIEQRKQLLNVTRVLNKKNPKLVTAHCWTVLQAVCSHGPQVVSMPFQHVEAAVRYVYELGEGLHMNCLKDAGNEFTKMIGMMLHSSIVHHPSSVVHLAYFEVLDRYHPFFIHFKEYVPTLLSHLLQSSAGVCNPSAKVRSKNCLIFCRLVTVLKVQFAEHSPTIISTLLVVLGHTDIAPGLSLPAHCSALLSPGDRCDIYEGLGALLAATDLSACATIVQLIVSHIQFCTQTVHNSGMQEANAQTDFAVMISDDISFLSSLAKGLGGIESTRMPESPPLQPRDTPLVAEGFPNSRFEGEGSENPIHQTVRIFYAVTDAVMTALGTWGAFPNVREKGALFMHQVINILGGECLGFVRTFVLSMLPGTSLPEVGKLCRVTFQAVNKTRSQCVGTLADILPALVGKVNELAGSVADIDKVHGVVAESVKERVELFKNFFLLLHAITHVGCTPCLETAACQPSLPMILVMLTSALRTSPELDIVPKSLQVVGKLTTAWCTAESDVEAWLLSQYIPAVFEVASSWPLDAKTMTLVGDIAGVLLAVTSKLGDRGLYSVFALLTAAPLLVPSNDAHTFLSAVKDAIPDARAASRIRGPLRDLLLGVQRRQHQNQQSA